MKKIVLSLAGVLAATAFAPEASAVPAFARQTGMACSACHYQHFPLLNGFGRAFKSSGFTMMGAQAKVEGEHLDIPDRVNMAIYATTAISNESSAAGNNLYNIQPPTTGGEFSLFMGGRGSDFAGFIAEAGLGGGGAGAPADQGGVVGAMKIALLAPVGDNRMGVVIHSSQGQGVAYSFETLNTGAANTHKLMGNAGPSSQHVRAFSASQYFGTNTAATGTSFVFNNSMGFVNIGLYEQAGNNAVTGATALNLNYARAVYTADIAGFDMGFGVQRFGGESTVTARKNDLTVVDAQAQGDVAGMPLGVYASYGTAAASGTVLNEFNQGSTTDARTSLNVAATLEFMPGATVQGAVRMAKTNGLTDNAVMIGGTYDLAQNIALGLNYTTQSGDTWTTDTGGKNATTLLLETLF
jgi:hypothetical protein